MELIKNNKLGSIIGGSIGLGLNSSIFFIGLCDYNYTCEYILALPLSFLSLVGLIFRTNGDFILFIFMLQFCVYPLLGLIIGALIHKFFKK